MDGILQVYRSLPETSTLCYRDPGVGDPEEATGMTVLELPASLLIEETRRPSLLLLVRL